MTCYTTYVPGLRYLGACIRIWYKDISFQNSRSFAAWKRISNIYIIVFLTATLSSVSVELNYQCSSKDVRRGHLYLKRYSIVRHCCSELLSSFPFLFISLFNGLCQELSLEEKNENPRKLGNVFNIVFRIFTWWEQMGYQLLKMQGVSFPCNFLHSLFIPGLSCTSIE